MSETLTKFKEYLEKLSYYEHVSSQLYWDMQTQMPEKGMDYKVDTIAFFSMESFKLQTSEEYGAMLEALSAPEEFQQLDEGMKVTVKRRKKYYEEDKKVPQDFYEKMVREGALSEKAWEEAKEKSDYSIFCPHLQNVINNRKELLSYTHPGQDPYEVLLDAHEEGMDSKTIDRIFAELKAGLVPLIQEISKKPHPDSTIFQGDFDINKQREFCEYLLKYIGFDMKAGVMGESAHPFTMGFGPRDVRVTNHYRSGKPIDAMFSIIHEGGHGLFEQGIAEKFEKTDVANINFMGLHESQSRFYENILGRNIHFWKPIYGKLQELLPQFKNITLEQFEREINRVIPSFIRTEADEVTYSIHIILRYEIEKAIFRDGLTAEQLPEIWNQKMVEMLGICPENDAEGILQDTHWSGGMMGYFPSYALGSIYDGMFLEKITEELGDLDRILEEGRIGEITAWLKENIHQYGSLYNSRQVIERICGKEISAQPLLKHFREKYSRLYEL